MNPYYVVGVGFSNVFQQFQVGFYEIGPAFTEDTEHFGSLHPDSVVIVVYQFRKQRQVILVWIWSIDGDVLRSPDESQPSVLCLAKIHIIVMHMASLFWGFIE